MQPIKSVLPFCSALPIQYTRFPVALTFCRKTHTTWSRVYVPYHFLDASDTLPAYRRSRAICNGWVSVRPSVDRRSTSAAYRARAAYIARYIYTGARAAAAGRVMLQAEARLRRDVRRCKRVGAASRLIEAPRPTDITE